MCIVFAVYEYYICIVHFTFLGFMAIRQDYFTLLRHGKQVDGTEKEVLHRDPPHHLHAKRGFSQAVRMGFEPAQIQQWKKANKKSVTNSLDMAATYITFECSFISLDIRITSTYKNQIKHTCSQNVVLLMDML